MGKHEINRNNKHAIYKKFLPHCVFWAFGCCLFVWTLILFFLSSLCLLLMSVIYWLIYLFISEFLTMNNYALRFFIYLCLSYNFLKGKMACWVLCCMFVVYCHLVHFGRFFPCSELILQTDCCCEGKIHNNQSVGLQIHHHRSQGNQSVSNLILWFLTRYQWCERFPLFCFCFLLK